MLLLISAVIQITQCQLYDQSKYYLSTNLIQNSGFDQPYLSQGFTRKYGSIPSWTCDTKCEIQVSASICANKGLTCDVNWRQCIDFNSNRYFDKVTQIVSIQVEGKYLVHLEWMRPFKNQSGQQLSVKINNTVVGIITADTTKNPDFKSNVAEFIVELPRGNITFSLQQIGLMVLGNGILASNIKLQRLVPTQDQNLEALLNNTLLNNVTSALNSLPGCRIYFYSLLNFLSAFDRLQFYYFHRQNMSFYAEKLLLNVNKMALQRGNLLQNLIQNCDNSFCTAVNDAYQQMVEKLDRQKNYTHPNFLLKNEKGIGFFANNLEYFFFELPIVILIYVIFSVLSRVFFKYRITNLIKKYSLYGILLLIIFEGNIQQFSFYFFSECRLLYSATVVHKLGRYFMLLIFFFMIIFSVCGLTLFFVYYKKLIQYFMEDCSKYTLIAILFESLEKSIFPLLFGAVHALFIDNPFIQTIVLIIVQSLYLCTKIIILGSDIAKYKFKVVLLSMTSLLRLVLIGTLYFYEKEGLSLLINLIHHDIVWLYLICWAVEVLFDGVCLLADIVSIVFKPCISQPKKGIKKPENKTSKHGIVKIPTQNEHNVQPPPSKSKKILIENQKKENQKKQKPSYQGRGQLQVEEISNVPSEIFPQKEEENHEKPIRLNKEKQNKKNLRVIFQDAASLENEDEDENKSSEEKKKEESQKQIEILDN